MPPNGRKRQKSDQETVKETIHSGHFMVSDIDDAETPDGDDSPPSLVVHESDCDQESSPIPAPGYDFESACKETSKTYTFGPRSSRSMSIDASLTKLFECMTLAYSGKLTSPRWKQFKGLKMRLKEKIRLNNMIWRAWHMQFVMKMKTMVCQFASPLEGDTHTKPEAVVIEGTYWKRKMANITAEYQKWRLYYKDRFKTRSSSEAENMAVELDSRWSSRSKDCFTAFSSNSMDEDFFMDFSDTLFSTFNPSQPFDFPNPREIAARAGIADFIQPGLVQLQPSVDDFMDTFEPLHDFLSSRLPTLPEENCDGSQMTDVLSTPSQSDLSGFTSNTSPDILNQQNLTSNSLSKRNNNFLRKSFMQQNTHQRLSSSDAGKAVIDNLINVSTGSNMLSPEIILRELPVGYRSPPQSQNSSTTLTDTNQFSCSNSSNELTLTTMLQQNLQSGLPAVQSDSSSNFRTSVIPHSNLMDTETRENTSQCFLQTSTSSNVLNRCNLNIAPKQTQFVQSAQSVQVPISFSQQQPRDQSVLNQSNSDTKNQNFPVLVAVDLGILNQALSANSNTSGTFNTSLQVSEVSSQLPFLQQSSAQLKNDRRTMDFGNSSKLISFKDRTSDTPVFRRHSHATHQYVKSEFPQHSADIIRRTRPIAPAVTSSNQDVSFAVPEIPIRQRTRSRSVSSPQGGSPKPFVQQTSHAISLTDINLSPPPPLSFVPASNSNNSKTVSLPSESSTSLNSASAGSPPSILPQNAVLAQLLSSGRLHDLNTSSKKSTKHLSSTSSPVTIQPAASLITTMAHSSSIPLAAISGVSDFQRSLLVSAANHIFGNQSISQNVINTLPSSPGPSTCSTAAMTSFDSGASKIARPKSDEERIQYKEHRRVCHINAEQKRRCNIKNGFEALHHLLPPLNQNPNAKISKAAMLHRGAEYIRQLKTERQQQQEEAEQLKQQIEALNQAIGLYQSQLPASGVPMSYQRTNRMKEMFEEYVRQQTLKNWKFWIFSLILEPLVESYNNNVSTASMDEMCKTILAWLDQHCSLVALRPGVLNSLRHLSTTTNILTDPSCMPEEATRAVTKKESRQQ